MIEQIKHKGIYQFNTRDGVEIVHNTITAAALSGLAAAFITGTDLAIKYVAFGTSNAAVTGNETQLGAEIFRTAVTDAARVDNVVTTDFQVLSGEAIGSIAEVGIFCGADATDDANTGILLSRILWAHTKTGDEEITVTRTDTIERG